jgi:hypothetical protein
MHDRRGNRLRDHVIREEPTVYGATVTRIYIDGSWSIAQQIGTIAGGSPEWGESVAAVDGGRWSQRVNLRSSPPPDIEETLDLLSGCLTLEHVEPLDLAIALDFYKSVVPGVDPMSWPNTEVGELVNQAKYHLSEAARQELVIRLGDLAVGHPMLRRAVAVAAVPDSGQPTSIGRILAAGVADRLGVPVVPLIEFGAHATAKGSGPGDRIDLTFDATGRITGEVALVVDDVLRRGQTMAAAGTALRKAGALRVRGLVAARTVSS